MQDLSGDLTDGRPDAGNQCDARNRVCNGRQDWRRSIKDFKEGERKADERAAHLEQLIKELAGKTKVQPGMDLVAEAQQWKARYEELLSKSQLVEGADPPDK